ncbi:CU044_2847 family protein [Streptomyces scopuliridis]|uniref:CU044_2847 family protein n=1 Tax=Streptomyces scopuliridis TaxID=452529 RepID=UPI0036CFF599
MGECHATVGRSSRVHRRRAAGERRRGRTSTGEWRRGGRRARRTRNRAVVRAERSPEQMLDVVRPVADVFAGRCRGMLRPPDEATLEFGMSLSADAKVLVTGSFAGANFSVSLTWHSSPAGTDAVPVTAPGPESAGQGPAGGLAFAG